MMRHSKSCCMSPPGSIHAPMQRIETQPYWPDIVAVKDSLSLRQLADRWGCTPGAIADGLKRQGLTRRSAPPGPRRDLEHRLEVAIRAVVDAVAAREGSTAQEIAVDLSDAARTLLGSAIDWCVRSGLLDRVDERLYLGAARASGTLEERVAASRVTG